MLRSLADILTAGNALRLKRVNGGLSTVSLYAWQANMSNFNFRFPFLPKSLCAAEPKVSQRADSA